jgi:predicted HTH domain antitoxin
MDPEDDKMNRISIEYSQNLPDILQVTKKAFEEEAKMAMAVKLFEMKRLSSGLAASLAGMERTKFLLNLHRYNVPMIDLEEDELFTDLNNA